MFKIRLWYDEENIGENVVDNIGVAIVEKQLVYL